MLKIDFNRLKNDTNKFIVDTNTSYIKTYEVFVQYFQSLKGIEFEHFVVGSHFVYGWMPTILNLKTTSSENILGYLNDAKQGVLLTEMELETLKASVNNSIVGVSKLLHFINPRVYAIWDSRICRYILGSTHRVNLTKVYLEYLDEMHRIVALEEFMAIHERVQNACGYDISPMRACELVMFSNGKP